jgi:hypothetical protein
MYCLITGNKKIHAYRVTDGQSEINRRSAVLGKLHWSTEYNNINVYS